MTVDQPEHEVLETDIEVPISAIEHYSYCARQCALIHVEQTFDEKVFTIRGQLAHERVEAVGDTVGRGVRTARSIPLWSEHLRLRGKAELVEFRPDGPYSGIQVQKCPLRGENERLVAQNCRCTQPPGWVRI
jgi:CRISPR-associated exonuclease Cas4